MCTDYAKVPTHGDTIPSTVQKHRCGLLLSFPMETARAKRRCRTLTEQQSPHTQIIVTQMIQKGEKRDLANLETRKSPLAKPIPPANLSYTVLKNQH